MYIQDFNNANPQMGALYPIKAATYSALPTNVQHGAWGEVTGTIPWGGPYFRFCAQADSNGVDHAVGFWVPAQVFPTIAFQYAQGGGSDPMKIATTPGGLGSDNWTAVDARGWDTTGTHTGTVQDATGGQLELLSGGNGDEATIIFSSSAELAQNNLFYMFEVDAQDYNASDLQYYGGYYWYRDATSYQILTMSRSAANSMGFSENGTTSIGQQVTDLQGLAAYRRVFWQTRSRSRNTGDADECVVWDPNGGRNAACVVNTGEFPSIGLGSMIIGCQGGQSGAADPTDKTFRIQNFFGFTY